VSQTAGVQHVGRRLSLRPHTLTYDQTTMHSPGLPFNGLHSRNPCHYTDNYSFTDRKGWKAELAWLGLPVADILPTKWSHVKHRSGKDQGKSASLRSTS